MAGTHRGGQWGCPPDALLCPSLRCGVQAAPGRGSGTFPRSGWKIQNQPWPPRLTPVSREASGADGRAHCPMAHPHSCSCCKYPGGDLRSHGRGLRRTAAGFSLKIPPSPQLSFKALKILLPWLRLPRTKSPLCAVLTRQPGREGRIVPGLGERGGYE